MVRARRAALVALAAALLLAAAIPATAPARSGDGLGLTVPGNQSAGDQYVETLPTTKGPRAPGRHKHGKKLPHGVAKRLQRLGGSDAAALKALATSPGLGAPAVDAGGSGRRIGGEGRAAKGKSSTGSNGQGSGDGRARDGGKRHGGSTPAVPSAAIHAVDDGGAGLGWLVLALVAITAVSLGALGYQRHRHKRPAK